MDDKEEFIAVDKGVGRMSPDVRKKFAPLEVIVPEQRYKKNIDLDLIKNRRPS